MINNCKLCNKAPKINVVVSCENAICPEFDVEYFVWDWQVQNDTELMEVNRIIKLNTSNRVKLYEEIKRVNNELTL